VRAAPAPIADGVQVKRRFRLTEKERFRLVRQTGVSYTHPLLVVCLLANDQPFSRCGFTVSRRLGKAVERNRVRRRLSEAVRLIWDLIAPGWDVVWIARPAIQSADFAEIQEACIRLLKRGRALRAAETGVTSAP
jgi:ribonuclease P protein component